MKQFYILLIVFITQLGFSQNFHDTQGKLEISNSGQSNYTLPIAMPPSLKNVGPIINLTYSSGQLGGIAGQGWSISAISNICRMASRKDIDGFVDGVDFDDNDKLALDGQRLVLKTGTYWADGSTYETEIQSNTKVELKGSGTSTYFIVTAADGSRSWYGNYGGMSGVDLRAFYIVRFEDTNGNYMTYHYSNPFGKSLCISEIKFSGNTAGLAPLNSIKFNYKQAKRTESAYINTVKVEKVALLDFVDVTTNGQLFRKYQLTHTADAQLGYENVSKIQEFNGATEAANPVEFEYRTTQSTNVDSETKITYNNNLVFEDIQYTGDFDGDGHLDFGTRTEVYTKMFQGSTGNPPLSVTSIAGTEGFFAATTINNNKLNQFQSLVTRNLRYNAQIKFNVYNLINNVPVLSYGKTFTAFNDNLIYHTLPYEVHTSQFVTEQQAAAMGLYANPNAFTSTNGPLAYDNDYLKKEYLEGDYDGNGISEVLIFQPTMEYQSRITDYYIQGNATTPIAKLTDNFIKPSGALHAYMVDLDPSASTAQGGKGYVKLDNNTFNILYGETKLVADFNSDGKSDLLVITPGKAYKIITFKQLTAAPWVQMEVIGEGTLDLYSKTKQLLLGDYNGDGKTDLMLPDTEGGSGQTGWSIYYSNPNPAGGGFFVKESHTIVEYWPDTKDTWEQRNISKYYALDTNGDGKSDLVRVWEKIYRPDSVFDAKDWDTQWIVTTFVNNIGNTGITGNKFTADYTSPCVTIGAFQVCNHRNDSPDLPYPIVSNYKYNGANKELLMVRNHHNELTYINFSKDVSQDILLTKVTASGGSIVDAIAYKTMEASTDNGGLGNLNEFYSSLDSAVYPNVEIKNLPSSYLVSLLTNTIEGTTKYQDFRYNGMLVNVNGLGALGFNKMARSAWYTSATDKRTWSVIESNPLWRNAIKRTYTELVNTGNAFTFVTSGNPAGIVNSDVNTFTAGTTNNIYSLLLDNKLSTDHITNVITKTSYAYDPLYLVPVTVTTENFLGSTLQGTVTVTNGFIHNPSGGGADYYIGRPVNTKTVNSAYGDTFEISEKYTYTNNRISKLEKKGNTTSTVYQTEEYDYDAYGNIIKKTMTIPGATPAVAARIVEYTYDPTGRFIKTTKDIEGLTTTNNSYHPLYGLVTSSSNVYGSTSASTYDNWGKVTKDTDFLGKSITYTYAKGSNEYTTTKTGDDGSSSITVTDVLGRVKKTGLKNIDDTWSYKNLEYDYLGRKYRESEPYSSGAPTLWNTITYDDYSRLFTSTTATGKITTINYNGLVVTANDGTKTTSSTKDANGSVVTASDNGGIINYTYYANGNVKDTNYLTTKISMKYNEWGVKTELVDPSAGTYSYTYYPTGEIHEETTPNGKTTYTYTDTGKLLSKTILGLHTDSQSAYVYDPVTKLITSSTFTDNLEAKTTSYTYDYDSPHRRLTKTTEITPYARFEKEILSFDAFGRVSTEKSTAFSAGKSSSKTITNTFKNGYPWQILDGTTVLWQTNSVNARGQLTSAALGNGMVLTNTYDEYGYINSAKHALGNTNVIVISTMFDVPKGNLKSKGYNFFNHYEEYGYDALDRLTTHYITDEFINNTFSTASTEGFLAQGGATVNSSGGQLATQAAVLGAGTKKTLLTGAAIGDKIIINFKLTRVLAAELLNVYVQEIDPVSGTVVKSLKATSTNTRDVYIDYTVSQYSTVVLSVEKGASTSSLNVFLLDNVTVAKKFTTNQAYDDRGRITSNETGAYNYTAAAKVYQNTSINVTPEALTYYQGRNTQNISYNVFKSPFEIEETGIDKISFTYNDNNDRSSMFYGGTNAIKTSRSYRKDYSADGTMEIKTTPSGVEFVTYIGGDGYTAPLVLKSDGTNQNYLYLHRDYQGSILAITNNTGAILEKRLFDAWGLLLKVQDGAGNALAQMTLLDRGYTGHEHLQSVGLIHMNGRLYDPKIRRFLQPDNNIQEPYNTQNYNRYGYCLNNPLKYTDVTGELWGMGELLSAVVIGAIIAASTYSLMAVTGHVDFSVGGLVKSIVVGAISGAVTFGIGQATSTISNVYLRAGVQAFAHGHFQGVMAGVQGGDGVSSAVSGAVSSIAASAWGGMGIFGATGGQLARSGTGMVLFGTVSGGAAASLTGGNFWQGAGIGLVVSLLNHSFHMMEVFEMENGFDKEVNSAFGVEADSQAPVTGEALDKVRNLPTLRKWSSRVGNPKTLFSAETHAKDGQSEATTELDLVDHKSSTITYYGASFSSYRHLAQNVLHELGHARFNYLGYRWAVGQKYGDRTGWAVSEFYAYKFASLIGGVPYATYVNYAIGAAYVHGMPSYSELGLIKK